MRRLCLLLFICVASLPVTAFAAFLGPYSGTVLDIQTEKPVEGATVFMYWVRSVPQIVLVAIGAKSEMIDLRLVYTDKKGKYKIPWFIADTGLAGRLEATVVVIYQPGYQAYIKRIWHWDPKPDLEFKEKNNIVKFERIPPNFDHHGHYEEIESALWGLDEYRNDALGSEETGINEIEWKKMVEFDKKVLPYRQELLRRAKWEERRGRER